MDKPSRTISASPAVPSRFAREHKTPPPLGLSPVIQSILLSRSYATAMRYRLKSGQNPPEPLRARIPPRHRQPHLAGTDPNLRPHLEHLLAGRPALRTRTLRPPKPRTAEPIHHPVRERSKIQPQLIRLASSATTGGPPTGSPAAPGGDSPSHPAHSLLARTTHAPPTARPESKPR